MIKDIKTYINTKKIKVGDILYGGDPQNVSFPSYKIILSKTGNECAIFDTVGNGFYPRYKVKYLTDDIYHIEEIKEIDIKRILRYFKNSHFKNNVINMFDNVINVWIEKFPKIQEYLNEIEIEINTKKYNL